MSCVKTVAQERKQLVIVSFALAIVTHVASGQPLKRLDGLPELSPVQATALGISSVHTGVPHKPAYFLDDRMFATSERPLKLPDNRPRSCECLSVGDSSRPVML